MSSLKMLILGLALVVNFISLIVFAQEAPAEENEPGFIEGTFNQIGDFVDGTIKGISNGVTGAINVPLEIGGSIVEGIGEGLQGLGKTINPKKSA